MNATKLWKQLHGCAATPFPAGWPHDTIVLFAPQDDVAGALELLVGALETSIRLEMFTYCDKRLHAIVAEKADTDGFDFQATFDQSQYEQVPSMAALLVDWATDPRVAIGRSEHDEIVHRKVLVGDHCFVVSGSTNWTSSGERYEDNELAIRWSPRVAAAYERVLAANHARIRALQAAPAPAAPGPVASASGAAA